MYTLACIYIYCHLKMYKWMPWRELNVTKKILNSNYVYIYKLLIPYAVKLNGCVCACLCVCVCVSVCVRVCVSLCVCMCVYVYV